MILIDSNCLLRLADMASALRLVAKHALTTLHRNGEALIVVPQNFYEFWATATRATAFNGLGMSTETTHQWLNYIARRFTLLPDMENLLATWRQLVQSHTISGYKCHDARLVAAMKVHSIDRILTFNGDDFKKYAGIIVVDPNTV